MSSAATSGSTTAGFLPASLAALLSLPLDAADVPAPLGTRSVGSFFSTPPAPLSFGRELAVHIAAASSASSPAGAIPSLPSVAPESALMAGLSASGPAAAPSAPAPFVPPAASPVALTASMVPSPQAVSSMGSSPPPSFHFGHLITIKLSSDNYIF